MSPATTTFRLLFRHRAGIQSWRGLRQVSPILSTDAPTESVDGRKGRKAGLAAGNSYR